MAPKSKDEALSHLRSALAEGKVEYGKSTLADTLGPEIQEIFSEIRLALTGKAPKRLIWASDSSRILDILDWKEGGGLTEGSIQALKTAGKKLGLELSGDDLFVDTALRLRYNREADAGWPD